MEQIFGFGAQRFPIDPNSSQAERDERTRIMIARALNLRTTVAFLGSGCSAPMGYPNWRKLVLGIAGDALKKKLLNDSVKHRLERIVQHVRARWITAKDLMNYFGECQRALNAEGDKDAFHHAVAERINRYAAKAKRDGTHNPYNALMSLPIERYVTSNYDDELERAITARKGIQDPVRFTQIDHGKLAGFAVVGVPELRQSVFHCHGSVEDISSIVASESDYQRWYMTQRDVAATTFRESLRLLFGSNPILFLGFSMEDDDLLQTLRTFSADEPELKASRPLFALAESSKRDRERVYDYFERYGINVLPYDRPSRMTAYARGLALSREIARLEHDWRTHADRWSEKPSIRNVRVPVHPNRPYQHYSIERQQSDVLAPNRTQNEIARLLGYVREASTRVIVITGDGGTGKSWRALNLLKSLKELEKPERGKTSGVFFWSSYYADDWLTGLDRALAYFEPKLSARSRRLDRFGEALRSGEHVIVFDGFERLLREVGNTRIGLPYSESVRRLLEIATNAESRSTVILTTRLMPQQFIGMLNTDPEDTAEDSDPMTDRPRLAVADPRSAAEALTNHAPLGRASCGTGPKPAAEHPQGPVPKPVRQFSVHRLTTEDLKEGDLFESIKDDKEEALSIICSLCGGHSYAVLLAAKYLTADRTHDKSIKDRLDTFRRKISRRAPDSRNTEIIKLAITAVDDETNSKAMELLERVALFMSPVRARTFAVCLEEAGIRSVRQQRRVVNKLLKAKLLLLVSTPPGASPEHWPGRVTVHPTVRSLVFYDRHSASTGALPNFTLAGFTSGNSPCYPGNDTEGVKRIISLFDKLCTRAADKHEPKKVRREMCRAAFSLMRSRMESNTVPRWTNYEEYIRHGLRLLYVAKGIAGNDVWGYRERTHSDKNQKRHGVFYADELAWLYNDIGLALCSEGHMADAYSLWEQGFEIDRVTDSEEEGGQYLVQSHLHMSHLFLELGLLRRAGQFLTTTERANELYGDVDFKGRIFGYRALLAHLAGNFDEAQKLYRSAIRLLTSNGRRNVRAASMFHRHWSDLLTAAGKLDDATEHVETALSLALEGEFPDLEAYARKSRAHIWRERKQDLVRARAEYTAAMTSAQKFGIRRLQADIHSELARLALDVGDWESARVRAMESLMLANEMSLGIRRTHGMVILGLAMEAAGNNALAISYLKHASALARVQGYYLRGREAEQHLQRLEPSGE